MKNQKLQTQHQSQIGVIHAERKLGLKDKNSSSSYHVPFQQKHLTCIVKTTLGRFSHGLVDNTLQRSVFYRKPLLTPEGSLDKDRLVAEIQFHQ